MKQSYKNILIACSVLIVLYVIYYIFLHKHFSLESVKSHSVWLQGLVRTRYVEIVIMYIFLVSLLMACALPVMIPLTLMSGYLFGTLWGGLYMVCGVLLGCLVSFLLFRHFLEKYLHTHYGKQFALVHESMKRYGPSYILILHYSAVVPLFIINSSAALTHMRLPTFLWMSFLGLLPVCFIYAFAGRELTTIQSFSDIFSVPVIGALGLLVCLALLPIFIRKMQRTGG